jgi:hypothetical protein
MKMNSLVGLAHNWHTKQDGAGGTLLLEPVPVALKDRYFIAVKGETKTNWQRAQVFQFP